MPERRLGGIGNGCCGGGTAAGGDGFLIVPEGTPSSLAALPTTLFEGRCIVCGVATAFIVPAIDFRPSTLVFDLAYGLYTGFRGTVLPASAALFVWV